MIRKIGKRLKIKASFIIGTMRTKLVEFEKKFVCFFYWYLYVIGSILSSYYRRASCKHFFANFSLLNRSPSTANDEVFLLYARSLNDGNCMYSSFWLLLISDNSFVQVLRCLTSIELFKNSDYFDKCSCFVSDFNSQE